MKSTRDSLAPTALVASEGTPSPLFFAQSIQNKEPFFKVFNRNDLKAKYSFARIYS